MKIIFSNTNTVDGKERCAILSPAPNFLATLTGTEEEKLIHIANKNLPTGTKYEIVEDDSFPTDRDFRNAWEYVVGAGEKTGKLNFVELYFDFLYGFVVFFLLILFII